MIKENNGTKKYSMLVVIIVAIGLGTGAMYSKSLSGVPSCMKAPDCRQNNPGTLSTKKYGYPLAYKEVATFEPMDKTNFATASVEVEGISWINIAMNAVFWYALITLGVNIYKSHRKSK